MPVAYLKGTEEVTPAPMNAAWSSFDAKLNAILGGRSPIAVWNAALNGPFPARLLGIPIFFLEGICVYANNVSGFSPRAVTVPDPVTGGTATGTGGYSYDHAAFVALAAGVTPVSFDTTKRIVHVANIPQASYPAGITKLNGVGAFEHSLGVHTLRATAPGDTEEREYYIQENFLPDGISGGAAYPTKKYEYARADIIIEGPSQISIPANGDFGMLVFHNLQLRGCTVSIGSGKSAQIFQLNAFECKTFRRNRATRALEPSPFRYFCQYADDDPRMFWFFPSAPGYTYTTSSATRTTDSPTKPAGMGANNLINPAIIHEWIQQFTRENNFAFFKKDVHELCDIYTTTPQWANYFGDPSNPNTRLGDLIHHKGTITIKRLSKTLKDPLDATKPLVTTDSVEFRGYATIVADFAAKKLAVTRAADGNLQITNADPDNEVDLLPFTTNLLKNGAENPTRNWRLPTGISLDSTSSFNRSPRKVESAIFESVPGTSVGRCPDPDRVTRKTVSTQMGGAITWTDANNTVHTRALPDRQTQVSDITPPTAKSISGIDQITVADLLSLNLFGYPDIPTQDFGVSAFENARARLTPFGLVVTFDEYVNVKPELLVSSSLIDYRGEAYAYSNERGAFHMKRAIRFPGHGFGNPQFDQCGWIPPFDGRGISNDYVDEISGVDGADFSLPFESIQETGVKVLTFMEIERMGVSGPAGYFWKMGQAANTFANTITGLDGLINTQMSHAAPLWYSNPANRNLVISADMDANAKLGGVIGRKIIAMPLSVDHFNGFAQVVNQLKTGKAASYQCVRIPWGALVLDFSAPHGPFKDTGDGLVITIGDGSTIDRGGGISNGFSPTKDAFGYLKSVGPAPADAFACILGGAGTLGSYWANWFGTVGVPIKTEQDLPGWNEFRLAPSYRASLACAYSANVSNVRANVAGVTRLLRPTENATSNPYFNTPCSWDIVADIVLRIDGVTFDPDESFSPGVTTIGYDSAQAVGIKTTGISLGDYAGVRWISIADFRTAISGLGFSTKVFESYIPLKLDRMSIVRTLSEDQPVSLSLPNTTLIAGKSFNTSNSTLTLNPAANLPAFLAGVTGSSGVTHSTEEWPKILTSGIGFRLAEDGEPVEQIWKILIPNTWTACDFQNRTKGKFSFEGITSTGLISRYLPNAVAILLGLTSNGQTVNANNTAVFSSMWNPLGFKTVPPWIPDDVTQSSSTQTFTQSTFSPGGRFNTGALSGGNHLVIRRANPMFIARIADAEGENVIKSQERYCSTLNSERAVFATRFESGEESSAAKFVNIPVAAVYDRVTYLGGGLYTGSPGYPRKKDWWEDADGFFMQRRGTPGPPPELEDVLADDQAEHSIKKGYELHQNFTCSRILIDPGSALIQLP